MAWPKLRNRRSHDEEVTLGNEGGTTPEGARWQPVASDGATAERRAYFSGRHASNGSPVHGGAVNGSGNAGAAGPSAGAGGHSAGADWLGRDEADSDSDSDSGDVQFWEWSKSDESFDLNGAAGPADGAPPGHDRSRSPVVTPVAVQEEPQGEGIGQHLGNLTHLSEDPRMRAWQRRVVIAVIVGVVSTIVLNWRYGLTLAVLAGIADTVYRSRTTFYARPGVRLTAAQRRTLNQLHRMRRKGYRAMHCSRIPDSEDQIDHLVIGPAGVFAIDSESWDKRMPVRTRNGRQLWHGPRSMKDRLEHAHWEAGQAAELLSRQLGSTVSVRPAMAVYGPKIPWDVATIRDVDVFSGPRLRKYLHRRARKMRGHRLTATDIERIEAAARKAFPEDPPA
jgi:Nuclease-related domain